MAKSLAVEYRPKTLDQVIGQPDAKRELSSIFKSGKVPAAMLISGDTGLGKTTLSRIIARTLNCKEGSGCGKCSSCEMFDINPDNHPDYKEINAATQRGIDDIRALIDLSSYRPRYGTRVIVLDECHQITGAAMEALLKSLEEPSENTLWILATTNPEKLKQTIVDRCLSIRLMPVKPEELSERLLKISKKAGVKLPASITEMLANNAGGYVRRAIAALEKLILNLGDKASKMDEKKLKKAVDEAFQATVEKDLMICAMQILALLYEGKKVPILAVLSQIEDFSLVASRLPYMNGFVIYSIMKMEDKSIKSPYFPSVENRTLWNALSDDVKTPEGRHRVLSNAIKVSHRIIKFRETLFSTSYPDKVTLAFTCLTDEPLEYIKAESEKSKKKK